MADAGFEFLIANLAAAIAVVLVTVLRKPVRSLLGARAAYALWLLVPLAPLVTLLPAAPRVVEIDAASGPSLPPEPSSAVFAPRFDIVAPAEVATPAPLALPATPSEPADPWLIGAWVWVAGVVAMMAWLLLGQSRFMGDARAGFAGPAVAGFIRPRIITPADFEERFEPAEREMILAHETIHIDHNDARINTLAALVRCLCWFNPAIHVAAYLMRIDQELACDALVVERHPHAKAVYASALLKAQLASRPLPLGCYWPAQDEHPLTERIEMLRRPSPARSRRAIGGAVLLLLAAGGGYTAWAAQPGAVQFVVREDPAGALDLGLGQEIASLAPANQTPAPAPQERPQELPSPPMQQSAIPAPENIIVFGSPPVLDVNSPIYLRGKVEKIEFGDTRYVAFLRATSIARTYENREGAGAAFSNTDLWELSPTNYFGDRDSIRADLMGKTVEVSGLKMTKDCKPACRIKVRDLILPRSSEAPQPRADESLLTQFGYWYDTAKPQMVRGKVERIEFSDWTFDAYIRAESHGVIPGRLYQARSEYRFPKADIERELMNKSVAVSGWRSREGINTFCDPVCGLYANRIQFMNLTELTPAGATLTKPSPIALRPRGDYYLALADFHEPIILTGKITRYVPTVLFADNPQLWIEASGVSPETTFGSKAGTVWVVAGFPFEPHHNYYSTDSTRDLRSQAVEATAHVADLAKRYSPKHPEMAVAIQEKATLEARIADEVWIGKTVTIRGFNAEDKRCQPQCLMAGNSIEWEQ